MPDEIMKPQIWKKPLLYLLMLILIAGAAVGGYYWQKQDSDQKISKLESDLRSARNDLKSAKDSADPVIVYANSGAISPSEKEQIEEKVTSPLVDYARLVEKKSTVSILITKRAVNELKGANDYQYSYDVIYRDGGYTGALFGDKLSIDWWAPECLNKCEFPKAFSDKYPEVAAKAQ